MLVRAAKRDHRDQVVGVAEAVAAGYGLLDLLVDVLNPVVSDADLHGGDYVGNRLRICRRLPIGTRTSPRRSSSSVVPQCPS